MRHIDRIIGHSYGKRRILFEEGLWCIYDKHDKTYIIHRCDSAEYAIDDDGGEERTWACGVHRGRERVSGCGETAPESIRTLYTIHRWER